MVYLCEWGIRPGQNFSNQIAIWRAALNISCNLLKVAMRVIVMANSELVSGFVVGSEDAITKNCSVVCEV